MNRYPTGEKAIDELTEFVAGRLAAPSQPYGGKPSLAERWWVEDRIAEGRRFPLPKLSHADGLHFCWRRACDNARERYGWNPDGTADLLLHQMTELLPAMFKGPQQEARVA